MAQSKYDSTEETTNLARVARIILGPCADVLRTILKNNLPQNLQVAVNNFLRRYPKNLDPPINSYQRNIIKGGDYNTFDISLLYVLLRNICRIKPHTNGWGSIPSLTDTSLSANIERIRLRRNTYYGHATAFSISNIDFERIYNDLFSIVKSLELCIGGSKYQNEMQNLKTCCMDPRSKVMYLKKLLRLENLEEEVEELKQKVKVLENAKVPFAVKDVWKWEQDDKEFLEIHTFSAMYDTVMYQPFVMFVGVPGSGKTATARHIALKLREKNYNILSIKDIKDIETYCDKSNPQVFVIDDVLGKSSLDMSAYDLINRYKENLLNPIFKKTKVLLTCRQQVFNNHKLSKFFLCNQDNVVLLHSEENAINEKDKISMLKIYGIESGTFSTADLASILDMFPLSCKLASTRESGMRADFFKVPIDFIVDELNDLQKRNPKQYASLVLMMANQNKLSKEIFDNENNADCEGYFVERKEKFLCKCNVSSHTESFKVINALSEMEGTYTMKCCDVFTFIHESLFEIVAYHFGKQCPNLMIQYMRCDYVAKYIKVKESPADEANDYSYDLCIRLDTHQYKSLAERLYRDVEAGNWCCVFGNIALKDQSVRSFFIDLMKEKKYEDLYRVFLSELEEDKRGCIKYKLDKNDKESNLINIINLLYEEGNQRAICWVIYYGHNKILEYLVDQILKDKKGVVDDLYGNPYSVQDDTFNEESANGDKDSANDVEESGNDNDDNDDSADGDSDLDSDTKQIISEQHRLILLSSLSGDTQTGEIVISNILKSTCHIGKRTTHRRITYPGISYSCKIKRENGGWKIEDTLFTGPSLHTDKVCSWPSGRDRVKVDVSSVAHPHFFFVQILTSMSLVEFVKSMSQYYATDRQEDMVDTINFGDLVAAQFDQDASWYRVRVCGFQGDDPDQLDLFYLDYGDSCYLNKAKVRVLQSQFLSLPFQAVRCKLANVCPKDGYSWEEAVVDRFKQMTYSAMRKVLIAKLVDINTLLTGEKIHLVELIYKNGEKDVNIAKQLCEEDLARWC